MNKMVALDLSFKFIRFLIVEEIVGDAVDLHWRSIADHINKFYWSWVIVEQNTIGLGEEGDS